LVFELADHRVAPDAELEFRFGKAFRMLALGRHNKPHAAPSGDIVGHALVALLNDERIEIRSLGVFAVAQHVVDRDLELRLQQKGLCFKYPTYPILSAIRVPMPNIEIAGQRL
jgi:hypothetical protein